MGGRRTAPQAPQRSATPRRSRGASRFRGRRAAPSLPAVERVHEGQGAAGPTPVLSPVDLEDLPDAFQGRFESGRGGLSRLRGNARDAEGPLQDQGGNEGRGLRHSCPLVEKRGAGIALTRLPTPETRDAVRRE